MSYINKKLIELNNYLKNRKVAIIGLGVSNIPLLDYMHNVGAKVTVFDNRIIEDIPKIKETIRIEKQMKYQELEQVKAKKKNRDLER